MSIASTQLFLEEIEKGISQHLVVDSVQQIMRCVADICSSYIIEHVIEADVSNDYLKAFLDAKEIEGRSHKTIKRYEYILGRALKSIGVSVRSITTFHLRSYLIDAKNQGMSDRTLEGVRSILSSFFGWLWKEGMIERNPCANIGPIKCKKQIRLPFTSEEIERMKESCDNIRDKAIISFLLSTGCRISEACDLNKEDVNFVALECKVLGKGNKERTVYIDAITAMLLRRYFLSRSDNHEALFVGKGSARMTPGGIRARLKTIEETSGVEDIHPHRFRRTLATTLINRGMPIQEVASILGHDKIDTTMTYVYIEKDNVKNAYRKYAS